MLSSKRYKYVLCDYRYIPRDLLEQVRGVEWTADDFYRIQQALIGNPMNMLFALIPTDKKEKKILGYLWAQGDNITKTIVINSISLKKQLWGKGIMKFTEKFMRKLQREQGFKRVYWLTNKPKAFLRNGYHYSKYSLMCIDEEV